MTHLSTCSCRADTIVTDSRFTPSVDGIRRRRQCTVCGARFTTLEVIVGGGKGRPVRIEYGPNAAAQDRKLWTGRMIQKLIALIQELREEENQ